MLAISPFGGVKMKTLCLQSTELGAVEALNAITKIMSKFATFYPTAQTAADMMECLIVFAKGPAAAIVVSRTSHTKIALVHEGCLKFRLFVDFGPKGSTVRAKSVRQAFEAMGAEPPIECVACEEGYINQTA